MTYNVFGETLNLAQSVSPTLYLGLYAFHLSNLRGKETAGIYRALGACALHTILLHHCTVPSWYGMVWYGMVWYGMVNVDLYSASSQKSLMRCVR